MSSRSHPDSPCRFSILNCPPFTRGCVIQAATTGPLIPTPWGWVLPRDGDKITQDSLLSVVLVGSKSCFCHQDNIVTWYRTRLFSICDVTYRTCIKKNISNGQNQNNQCDRRKVFEAKFLRKKENNLKQFEISPLEKTDFYIDFFRLSSA